MVSDALYEVKTPSYTVTFMLGADDLPATVENVDAEITVVDGSRWSATFMTLDEIRRVMHRWRETGEGSFGLYFQCPDLVIVESGGVPAMLRVLDAIVAGDGPDAVLARLDTW